MATAGEWSTLDPPLSESVLRVLRDELSFTTMTPVQRAAIPLFIGHKDVCVEACTGSGKTLAFVIPTIEILLRARSRDALEHNSIHALMILPIRELAEQVFGVLQPFADEHGMSTALCIGGETHNDHWEEVPNILVGTPGRLETLVTCFGKRKRPLLSAKGLEVLVLDEADRLLDMGFERTINSILEYLPKQRRTGLFSATQTREVIQLVRAGLRNPAKIQVSVHHRDTKAQQKTPLTLSNYAMVCPTRQKLSQIVAFLSHKKNFKIITFVLTCNCVAYFRVILNKMPQLKGMSFYALHGKMKQSVRRKVFQKFLKAASGVLITTDVAARGLDIPEVDWIIQADLPTDPDACVHRIGRTARIGKRGSALMILSPDEEAYTEFLKAEKVPATEFAMIEDAPDVTPLIREMALADRDVMEKGTVAFVSYVRGYKEHDLKYIFQAKHLDLNALAMCFGLLKMPNMPELRKLRHTSPTPFEKVEVDFSSIAYADPRREEARQKKLAIRIEKRDELFVESIKKQRQALDSMPWSKSNPKKRKRMEQKLKEVVKRRRTTDGERVRWREITTAGDESDDDDDWQQFLKEKKLKKKRSLGKLSKKEFSKRMKKLDSEHDDTTWPSSDEESGAEELSAGEDNDAESASTSSAPDHEMTLEEFAASMRNK